MAHTSFESRLERIHAAQGDFETVPLGEISPSSLGPPPVVRRKRKRHPLREHLQTAVLGCLLGTLAALLLVGLTLEAVPWGPGGPLHGLFYWLAMGGLALAPVVLLISLFTAARRPGCAVFSLGYLSGLSLLFVF